jgi:hypothetical protein
VAREKGGGGWNDLFPGNNCRVSALIPWRGLDGCQVPDSMLYFPVTHNKRRNKMDHLTYDGLDMSYPSIAIDADAIVRTIESECDAVALPLPLYTASPAELALALSNVDIAVDESELEDLKWHNTCNWENSLTGNIQFASVDIGNGKDCYDECLILLEMNSGDPRSAYTNQIAFVGVFAETGLASPNVIAYFGEHSEALEEMQPYYSGGSNALDSLLYADENGTLPEGYAVVRDDCDCPCFVGNALQIVTPDGGLFEVHFVWEGEHAC